MKKLACIMGVIYGLALVGQGVYLPAFLSNELGSLRKIEVLILVLDFFQSIFAIGVEILNKNMLLTNLRFFTFGIVCLAGLVWLSAVSWPGHEIVALVSFLMIGSGAIRATGIFDLWKENTSSAA